MIYTVKGFGVINKAEVDVFLEFSCFFYDPVEVCNLISDPLPFLNPAWISGGSQFTVEACLENFEHYFAIIWDECDCVVVWTLCGIALFWCPFPVLWPLISFPNLLAHWVQHFHSIIFRIWNSSTGILSPPLALFVVMLPKAHLTLYSRMSGSRWVNTPSWHQLW